MTQCEEGTCPICLQPIDRNSGCTDCDHLFCKDCILRWINESSACPLCRKEVKQIQFYVDGFYIGEEINVKPKKLQPPPPNPEEDFQLALDLDTEFINDEIIYEFETERLPSPLPTSGTHWINGRRESTRSRHSSNFSDAFKKLKAQLENRMEPLTLHGAALTFLREHVRKIGLRNECDQATMSNVVQRVSEELVGSDLTPTLKNQIVSLSNRYLLGESRFSMVPSSPPLLKSRLKLLPESHLQPLRLT